MWQMSERTKQDSRTGRPGFDGRRQQPAPRATATWLRFVPSWNALQRSGRSVKRKMNCSSSYDSRRDKLDRPGRAAWLAGWLAGRASCAKAVCAWLSHGSAHCRLGAVPYLIHAELLSLATSLRISVDFDCDANSCFVFHSRKPQKKNNSFLYLRVLDQIARLWRVGCTPPLLAWYSQCSCGTTDTDIRMGGGAASRGETLTSSHSGA